MCRINSQEKLGLTLCYRTDEEEDGAIYVSEVSSSGYSIRVIASVYSPDSESAFDTSPRAEFSLMYFNQRIIGTHVYPAQSDLFIPPATTVKHCQLLKKAYK